jgi:AcrR family transcriptional regulator
MRAKSTKGSLTADETKEQIITAAEELLRRHGPTKTRVVDVARHLGMSHANVYRHFENKAGIEDIIAERWLAEMIDPLEKYTSSRGLASNRLRSWVNDLIELKKQHLKDDPELFATYHSLVEGSRKVIQEHVAHLRIQIAAIIEDGVKKDEFKVKDIDVAARAVHEAITRFQHPFFLTRPEQLSDAVDPVMDLLIAGLKSGVI